MWRSGDVLVQLKCELFLFDVEIKNSKYMHRILTDVQKNYNYSFFKAGAKPLSRLKKSAICPKRIFVLFVTVALSSDYFAQST